MKLKDLAVVLRSSTGAMQEAVVYDLDTNQDLASGCSVDYAVKHYGDMELDRITAYGHSLVLSVRKPAETYVDVSLPRDALHETYDHISKVLTDIEQYDEVNPLMDDAYDALVDAHRLLASAIN